MSRPKSVKLLAGSVSVAVLLSACGTTVSERGTLAELRHVEMKLEDRTVNNGLDKAMDSYREFLKHTPESEMTPEAIRRIADLSIEKEYGYVSQNDIYAESGNKLKRPDLKKLGSVNLLDEGGIDSSINTESEKEFEARATEIESDRSISGRGLSGHPGLVSDLENENARKAIALYQKLLREYPLYDRNDQVLYQMSRAYEELGQVEDAMTIMNDFIREYPDSRYMAEVQFRRAEYFFTRKKYLEAEEAYQSIVNMGSDAYYYELALYKLGWSLYKQQFYDEALSRYIALLDHKVSNGYDFDGNHDPVESKLVDDTFRVISLSFSNLGGPEIVAEFFQANGPREYEDKVYSRLGEFYLEKRRYADAAGSYKTFIEGHPFDHIAPEFGMRVIEIYKAGRFGQLVVDAKKEFADTYALDASYWQHYSLEDRPEVVGYLKGNLKDLANHYHALYQDKRFEKEKPESYQSALVWYKRYLQSFPEEAETPAIHYQMADLMMENTDFASAATAYEYIAYHYAAHKQASEAGYAAIFAYRQFGEKSSDPNKIDEIKNKIIETSIRFADVFPNHEKVTLVLGAAADDLYQMQNYQLAVNTAERLVDNYPSAKEDLRRSAWLVIAHGSFGLFEYAKAESAYLHVLEFPAKKEERRDLTNNLAASIYKQGEEAGLKGEYQAAADHYLRIRETAPESSIRPKAEFDAATALIELESWSQATDVLKAFRRSFPESEFQPEITKKLAFVYKSDAKAELAASEYERIEKESEDEEVRRGALTLAAELYGEAGASAKQLEVYKRFVKSFPSPVEEALEVYRQMGEVYLALGDSNNHIATMRSIVAIDKKAGQERTDRTRYLAAEASLTLAEPLFRAFTEIELVQPIKRSLDAKKKMMQKAVSAYTALLDYEVADVTAASTYYIAEIYYNFSQALMKSERPDNLSDLELEQYELALEDQIYPFEEKSIAVHRKNVELLYVGVYSSWIDKSIMKLAKIFPALYAREEIHSGFVEYIDQFRYVIKIPKKDELSSDDSEDNSESPAENEVRIDESEESSV